MKWNVEVPTEGIPSSFFQFAKIIRDDDESTVREKMLAELLLQVGEAHNKLATSLNYGTAVVVCEERDIQFGSIEDARKPKPKH